MAESGEALLETPLAGLHRRLGGRMVPFAGYAMPVHYPAGIMAEHLACRAGAALFDVSHMGQAELLVAPMPSRAVDGWRHPLIPRGRERRPAKRGRRRRRRNRPPETLRHRNRVGKGPLESPALQGVGTDGERRASGGRPNLSGHRTEGGHDLNRRRSRQGDTWPNQEPGFSKPRSPGCTAA